MMCAIRLYLWLHLQYLASFELYFGSEITTLSVTDHCIGGHDYGTCTSRCLHDPGVVQMQLNPNRMPWYIL
jgi:hypothetical protein